MQTELVRRADANAAELPPEYWSYARIWFALGIPAFAAVIGTYGLMVFKP